MLEAFESSHQFLSTWAAWTGIVLAAVGLVVPLWQLVAGSLSRIAFGCGRWGRVFRRGRGVRPAAPELHPDGLRPDLAPALAAFAAGTRLLLVDLLHQQTRAHRWRDAQPGRASRWLNWLNGDHGEDYAPSTALQSQVWSWLRDAEALAERDLPPADHELLLGITTQIRGLIFGDADLSERVAAMVFALSGFDAGLRVHETSPYRGPVPGRIARRPFARRPHLDDERGDIERGTGEADRPSNSTTTAAPPLSDAGGSDSHAEILAEFEPAFRRIAQRYADDAAAREDLAQEIRLAVWAALPNFRGDASRKTYVLRIAYYCASRFGRRQFKFAPEPELRDAGRTALALLEREERISLVRETIGTLPANQRIALELLLDGCSYREIGERLGISETNASVRVSRARARLRAQLCATAS